MGNTIIGCILLVILVFAILKAKKRLKGGGSCCGGECNIVREKKTLNGPKLGEKTLVIAGMECGNCAIRVENALNRLENVLCKVDLKEKTALVSYTSEVSDTLLKQTVEELGYTVTEIR